MQEQEKQEQPNEQQSDKPLYQYFWAATVYTLDNKRTVPIYGVVEATGGQSAVDILVLRYGNAARYREFNITALNKV